MGASFHLIVSVISVKFFVTSDDANAPMPEKTEVKNDAEGHIRFGDITFKTSDLGEATEKTFTYYVSESGTQPGVTNDPETKTVKVVVKKDSTGKLTAETEVEGESLFTFTNTYHEAPVSVNPSVTKKIVGDTPEQKETFGFALTGISVNGDADKMPPMPADAKDGTKTVTVEGEGTQTFGEITFDKAGTYCYQVIEGTGENSDYTYDTTIYELTYVVTSKDGKLVAEESIQTQGDKASEKATAESLTFTNKYTKPHNDGDGSNGNGNNGGNGGNQGDNGNGSNGGDNGTTGNTGNNGNGGNNGSTGSTSSTSSTKKSTSSTGSSHSGSGKTTTSVSSHSHVPNTGDTSETGMLLGIMGIAAVMLAVVTVLRKKLMLRK